jgi:hypothetical protein
MTLSIDIRSLIITMKDAGAKWSSSLTPGFTARPSSTLTA